MIIKETLREALRSLWSTKQRTILALLGIIIGIGSVIAMVSVGMVVKNESLKQFQEMGTDIITISKSGGEGRDKAKIKLADALNLPAYCPEIISVAPYTNAYSQIKIKGKGEFSACNGVTASFFELNKLKLSRGRVISDLDIMMFYCVIGEELCEKLQASGVREVLGHKLFFNNKLFTVVGVLEHVAPSMMRPSDLNEGLLIPISTSLRMRDGGQIDNILARLVPSQDWQLAERQATKYFRTNTKVRDIRVRSSEQLIQQIQEQMRLFTLLLGAVGSISLIVGGVGVMNVMLVSVSERKREIGIRRALGARRTDIQFQFLVESILLCLLGGVLGIGLGIGVCYLVSMMNDWEFLISSSAAALGVGVSCLVGLFFGFYPARQASRLKPIEALRDA